MAPLGLPAHRVPRPLHRLLPLHLGGEGRQVHHHLVHGGAKRALAVLEVVEDPHACVGDFLQRPARLDGLTAEARLLGHDQRLKRGPGLERVQQPQKSWALDELGARDPIVGVDMPSRHAPPLRMGVGGGALDLARDGLLLVRDVLVGALASVDRGDHGVLLDRPDFFADGLPRQLSSPCGRWLARGTWRRRDARRDRTPEHVARNHRSRSQHGDDSLLSDGNVVEHGRRE